MEIQKFIMGIGKILKLYIDALFLCIVFESVQQKSPVRLIYKLFSFSKLPRHKKTDLYLFAQYQE